MTFLWLMFCFMHMCFIAGAILLVRFLLDRNIDRGDVKIAFQAALLVEIMLQGFHYLF